MLGMSFLKLQIANWGPQLNSVDALLVSGNILFWLRDISKWLSSSTFFFLFVLFVLNRASEEQFSDILWVILTFYRLVGSSLTTASWISQEKNNKEDILKN